MKTLKQETLKREIERAERKRDDALAAMLSNADRWRKWERQRKVLYKRLLKSRRDLRRAIEDVAGREEEGTVQP